MEPEQENLDIENQVDEKLKTKNRIEKLSEKVITTSKEKEEALLKVKAETDRADLAAKERDFYKGFSVNVAKYPNASQFQDKILEKVKSGYDIEDAMVSVLAKEGKLNSVNTENVSVETDVMGGSSPTILEGAKSIQGMNANEKFAALSELEKTGEISRFLTGR